MPLASGSMSHLLRNAAIGTVVLRMLHLTWLARYIDTPAFVMPPERLLSDSIDCLTGYKAIGIRFHRLLGDTKSSTSYC